MVLSVRLKMKLNEGIFFVIQNIKILFTSNTLIVKMF